MRRRLRVWGGPLVVLTALGCARPGLSGWVPAVTVDYEAGRRLQRRTDRHADRPRSTADTGRQSWRGTVWLRLHWRPPPSPALDPRAGPAAPQPVRTPGRLPCGRPVLCQWERRAVVRALERHGRGRQSK